ncbi:Uncharacterised protein [Tatumella ptyseos]|uniref:Uncharacterized protein n=1 Tax=Tatumella ptyseos TaxID=82987 RepID=A0A2X5PVP7_9GAMM|nr:Uncharacterised protein [Tatumella ptyseos]
MPDSLEEKAKRFACHVHAQAKQRRKYTNAPILFIRGLWLSWYVPCGEMKPC